MYSESFNLDSIKDAGEQKITLKKPGQKDDQKISELSFKYITKNVYTPPKKEEIKKSQKIIPA